MELRIHGEDKFVGEDKLMDTITVKGHTTEGGDAGAEQQQQLTDVATDAPSEGNTCWNSLNYCTRSNNNNNNNLIM